MVKTGSKSRLCCEGIRLGSAGSTFKWEKVVLLPIIRVTRAILGMCTMKKPLADSIVSGSV